MSTRIGEAQRIPPHIAVPIQVLRVGVIRDDAVRADEPPDGRVGHKFGVVGRIDIISRFVGEIESGLKELQTAARRAPPRIPPPQTSFRCFEQRDNLSACGPDNL